MALKYAVTRKKNYPFLSVQSLGEGVGLEGTIDLTVDEIEDYEDVVRRFAAWQEKLANAGTPA